MTRLTSLYRASVGKNFFASITGFIQAGDFIGNDSVPKPEPNTTPIEP